MTKKNLVLLFTSLTFFVGVLIILLFLFLSNRLMLPAFFTSPPIVIEETPPVLDEDVDEDDEELPPEYEIDVILDDGVDFDFYNKLFPFDSIDIALFSGNNTSIFYISRSVEDDVNRVITNTALKWMRINGYIDLVTTYEGHTTLIESAVGGPFNNVLVFTDQNKLVFYEEIDNFDKNSFAVLEKFFNNVKGYLAP